MGASQSVPKLVAAARANAKAAEDQITELQNLQDGSDTQAEDLRAAIVAFELIAIDIFSVFEARMQHHFRRGPFARKLNALLLGAKKTDLAHKFQQYYLAINVLKHGKGASYRELLETKDTFLVVKPGEDTASEGAPSAVGLVDVTVPGFFDGLATTILDAYQFLEKR